MDDSDFDEMGFEGIQNQLQSTGRGSTSRKPGLTLPEIPPDYEDNLDLEDLEEDRQDQTLGSLEEAQATIERRNLDTAHFGNIESSIKRRSCKMAGERHTDCKESSPVASTHPPELQLSEQQEKPEPLEEDDAAIIETLEDRIRVMEETEKKLGENAVKPLSMIVSEEVSRDPSQENIVLDVGFKNKLDDSNLSDADFLNHLDEEIKKTEESFKKMNDRFDKMQNRRKSSISQSPISIKRRNSYSSQGEDSGRVKGAAKLQTRNVLLESQKSLQRSSRLRRSLERAHQTNSSTSTAGAVPVLLKVKLYDESKKRPRAATSCNFDRRSPPKRLAERAAERQAAKATDKAAEETRPLKISLTRHHPKQPGISKIQKEQFKSKSILTRKGQQDNKPMFSISILLMRTPIEMRVKEQVFAYDTPITICDRMLKQTIRFPGQPEPIQLLMIFSNKQARKQVQNKIEQEINSYIEWCESVAKRTQQETAQKQREKDQQIREKRLRQAEKTPGSEDLLSTQQRVQFRKNQARVIARLSIIVAPNKKGDIVVREGQEDDASIAELVRNFVVCYGLKKEMMEVIERSVKALVVKELMEKQNETREDVDEEFFRDINNEN